MNSLELKNAVWAESGNECVYCLRRSGGQDKTVDHLIPLSSGGPTNLQNLVAACRGCNRRRSKAFPLKNVNAKHYDYVAEKLAQIIASLNYQIP